MLNAQHHPPAPASPNLGSGRHHLATPPARRQSSKASASRQSAHHVHGYRAYGVLFRSLRQCIGGTNAATASGLPHYDEDQQYQHPAHRVIVHRSPRPMRSARQQAFLCSLSLSFMCPLQFRAIGTLMQQVPAPANRSVGLTLLSAQVADLPLRIAYGEDLVCRPEAA